MKYNQLPNDYQAAFKDADIRGVYPTEINETVAYRVGVALGQVCDVKEIVVARDMRNSSPAIREALVAGLRDTGVNVTDLGLVPSTVLYFASGRWQQWGVMITASHNPADSNGLKIVMPGAVPVTNANGMRAIQKAVANEIVLNSKQKRGTLQKRSITNQFITTMQSATPLPKTNIRVVADAGNGMSAVMLKAIAKSNSFSVKILNETLDGSFPNRASNPMLLKNQKPIKQALATGKFDIGFSFDGDGDRVAVFDAKGVMINSAVIGAVIAERILRDHPGAVCINTVFTSRAYTEAVREAGGKMRVAKVGHAFIKAKMRAHDAVFACEHSGHFYFKDNFYADSALLALRHLLAAVHEAGSLQAACAPHMRYHQTEEVLLAVRDKKQTLQAVADHYKKQGADKVTIFDGVTAAFPNFWLTVKPSVTEDALKYVVESPTVKVAKQAQKELKEFLQTFSQ